MQEVREVGGVKKELRERGGGVQTRKTCRVKKLTSTSPQLIFQQASPTFAAYIRLGGFCTIAF